MTGPVYAIGDIHGQLAELDRVLALIEADGGPDAKVVFLGDYTDRGPDSRGVLDRLIDGQTAKRNWVFLMGNHDRLFRLFMEPVPLRDPYLMVELYWMHPRLGGDTTLASYGVEVTRTRREKFVHREALDAVPQAHVDFLHSLEVSHTHGDLFFAHAGIRPGVPLADQTEEDLIWIRKEFHVATDAHPKLIVHGHTPTEQATHYGNRVNLDAGAGYGKPLAVALFEDGRVWELTARGRQELLPRE
ncbi:MAG: serine/threonine protein phosphatase [Rhodobacteraceae bacterium]|nr:serine/threonine protein phosphatase [Paracoccaceae bacterium]